MRLVFPPPVPLDAMVDCISCGKPMRITKEQALQLSCKGYHFIEENGQLIPVTNKGLRRGSYVTMQNVEYGVDVQIGSHSDLYGCKIGNHTKINRYVEIQGDVEIGQFCKICSFTFICRNTYLADYVFIGPRVTFLDDKYPKTTFVPPSPRTIVGPHASIGAGSIILPGVNIGQEAMIGAGSLVTKSISPRTLAIGSPARFVRYLHTGDKSSP